LPFGYEDIIFMIANMDTKLMELLDLNAFYAVFMEKIKALNEKNKNKSRNKSSRYE